MKKLLTFLVIFAVFSTAKLAAQELTIFPDILGMRYYQDDTRLTRKQFKQLLLKDSESYELWKKSNLHLGIGLAAFAAEIGFLIFPIQSYRRNTAPIVQLVGISVSAGLAIGFTLNANSLQRKSILGYNKNLESTSFNFGPTYNGLGFAMIF